MIEQFFLTSDLHFSNKQPFSKLLSNGETSRLHTLSNTLLNGITKADCETKFFLGDILDRSRTIDPILANYVKDFFKKLKGEIFVFSGNHDIRYSFGKVHSMLKAILPSNIIYLEAPTSIQRKDCIFHIVPFYPSINILEENIHHLKVNYDKINIFFSHFSVEKAIIRDDYSIGNKWGAIKLALLKKFDYSFLGDIHISQEINNQVFYPGTPLQLNFGEEGQEKATWKVSIEVDTIRKEKIRSMGPEFKTIKIRSEEDLPKVVEEQKKGNYIRVISDIEVGNKLNLDDIIYIENPKEIQLATNLEYKTLIREYIRQKNEDLAPLLERFV